MIPKAVLKFTSQIQKYFKYWSLRSQMLALYVCTDMFSICCFTQTFLHFLMIPTPSL